MKSKHSPGPWSTNGRFVVQSPEYDKAQPGCPYIADCLVSQSARPEGTTDANAKLIAAAPDLLAALEMAEATINRLRPQTAPFDSTQGTRDVIRAAIAKATA